MLHISYGQRTENRELKAFNDMADFYKAERRMTASIASLARIGGSSLTDRRIEVSQADLEVVEGEVEARLRREDAEPPGRRRLARR